MEGKFIGFENICVNVLDDLRLLIVITLLLALLERVPDRHWVQVRRDRVSKIQTQLLFPINNLVPCPKLSLPRY